MQTQDIAQPTDQQDFLPINGTFYIEFFVGNAKQAAFYYHYTFGYDIVGYLGPETGHRDRASYVLQQNKVRFILTSPIKPEGFIADHVFRHGDGVRDIALWVDDARQAFRETTQRGAEPVAEPQVFSDEDGEIVKASIKTYGDTIHTFVEN